MKRNMQLVREILLWAEQQENGSIGQNPVIPEYTSDDVGYHVYLMEQGGLVKAALRNSMNLPTPTGTLLEITWSGYEFISAARNEGAWGSAMKKTGGALSGLSIDVIGEILKLEVKKQLGY